MILHKDSASTPQPRIVYSVKCSACNEVETFATPSSAKAIQASKDQGWRFLNRKIVGEDRVTGPVCPNCTSNIKSNKITP